MNLAGQSVSQQLYFFFLVCMLWFPWSDSQKQNKQTVFFVYSKNQNISIKIGNKGEIMVLSHIDI